MILQFTEKFTLEIPQNGKENYIINGKVLADTPKIKKFIKDKYKERDKIAIKNQKIQNKIKRYQQKAQNINDRIEIAKK